MSIKKKLGIGVLTGVMGLSLIGGGTFAYFSDTAVQSSTFASGTIDLEVDPEVNVELENLKPGDWMPRSFELQNNGSLNMKYISLDTEYSVTKNGQGVGSKLENQYADALIVQFLKNTGGDKDYTVIFETSLKDLRDMTPEDLATEIETEYLYVWPWPWPIGSEDVEIKGLAAGDTADFDVKFVFEETGKDQNHLQDLTLDLTWTFEGFQEDGEER